MRSRTGGTRSRKKTTCCRPKVSSGSCRTTALSPSPCANAWTPRTPKRAAARSKARPKAPVVVAEEQIAGKGRLEDVLLSCRHRLVLSIVLRPTLAADRGQFITCAAAVACAQAIEQVTGAESLIKWVNDIYCDGRKVAGILTEGVVDMESGRFEHAVLGIGVNVKPPTDGFPHDIADVAGAVLGDHTGAIRCELAAAILARFWDVYRRMEDPALYDEYRRRCFLLGQPLVVRQGASRVRAAPSISRPTSSWSSSCPTNPAASSPTAR